MKKVIFLILFSSSLFSQKLYNEFSIGILNIHIPVSSFSKVSNPGIGISLFYRLFFNSFLSIEAQSGYNYFLPKTIDIKNGKEENNYSIIPLNINLRYVILGYKKTFSPFLGIGLSIARFKNRYKVETVDSLGVSWTQSGSESGTKIGFNFNTGFNISLLEFYFSYSIIPHERNSLNYLSFIFNYRIPINEK